MARIDVKSLFTKVPVQDFLQYLNNHLTFCLVAIVRCRVVCSPTPLFFSYLIRTARICNVFGKIHTVENSVDNDLLSFVSTARNSFTADNTVLNVVCF